MSNKLFEDVEALVSRLRADYDRFCREIPNLQASKQVVTEELAELNKQIVDAQARLEEIREEIGKRTTSFNQWTVEEKQALETLKQNTAKELDTVQTGLSNAKKALNDAKATVDREVLELGARWLKLKELDAELKGKQQTLDAWSKRLIKQEKDQEVKQTELDARESAVTKLEQELTLREQKLAAGEQAMITDTDKARQDRQAASKLLNDAKEHIADVDAREDALELRGRGLTLRENTLKRKTAALDDRRNTMIANGMLEA